jgi:hypothetical protein
MIRNPCVRNGPDLIGDPAWIRTRDLQLRRLLLYPLSYGAVSKINHLAGAVES